MAEATFVKSMVLELPTYCFESRRSGIAKIDEENDTSEEYFTPLVLHQHRTEMRLER
jgi:hypothetical protein